MIRNIDDLSCLDCNNIICNPVPTSPTQLQNNLIATLSRLHRGIFSSESLCQYLENEAFEANLICNWYPNALRVDVIQTITFLNRKILVVGFVDNDEFAWECMHQNEEGGKRIEINEWVWKWDVGPGAKGEKHWVREREMECFGIGN
ncbi:hypothetical protein BJ508DRAFT_331130 [Ascobolus immersus RN42]|uniref:Uncharacterized protein n=1 Tax=Ascobolus immersus RN42 TaxID=1160509 RepID=A0A3N4HRJ8_ASCIM|nr:hypothetical protein BJ508DRAFT_331130 [Ascobolus immersus RN42]